MLTLVELETILANNAILNLKGADWTVRRDLVGVLKADRAPASLSITAEGKMVEIQAFNYSLVTEDRSNHVTELIKALAYRLSLEFA